MNPQLLADADLARRLISAMADGEADASECGHGYAAWADAGSGGPRVPGPAGRDQPLRRASSSSQRA